MKRYFVSPSHLEEDWNDIREGIKMVEVCRCEDIEKRICKNCKWRDEKEYCTNNKLREWDGNEEEEDELVYSFNEGGGFLVGKNFGCVHWEGK